MVLYAGTLALFLGLDFATAVLSASPGGTAEMAATAQALHLPVALISAFHVTRSVLVNGFAVYYWRGLRRRLHGGAGADLAAAVEKAVASRAKRKRPEVRFPPAVCASDSAPAPHNFSR